MKKILSTSAAAAALAVGVAAPAQAEVAGDLSVNAGFVSDYYFRGVNLGDGGAYGGLDYSIGGFYIGTWIIDDAATSCTYDAGEDETSCGNGNDGLETDYYLGYGMEHGDFSWAVGYTLYKYTYTSNYEGEFNLGVAGSFGDFGVAVDVAIGKDVDDEHDEGLAEDLEVDYQVVTLGLSYDIYGLTLGQYSADGEDQGFTDDTTYNWVEISAGGEIATMDVGVTIGTQFGSEMDGTGEDTTDGDGYIILDISKSFTF